MRIDELTTYKKIDNYREIVKEQREEISKREIIMDSLMASMVKEVKSIVQPYSDKMLHSASWGQTKDSSDENRKMFKFVTKDLLERLFDDKEERKNVKFIGISSYGYDSCAYGFYFKYKGINFEVKIPNIRNANKDNLYEIDFGKYQLFYEKKSGIWDHIKSSYDLDDIGKAIKDFVNWKDGEF